MKTVKVIIVGAGARGNVYANFALHHADQVNVVGVAEPREYYRHQMQDQHNIAAENVFADWQQVAERDKFADAVVISTLDDMHVEPAVALAEKGYHILLEKPLAPTADECRRIVNAALANDIIFGVCHVLRYTPYTQQLKALLDDGLIGEIISVQHLEPVGYWHQAHSFVRGNWRNETESSPMLLQKSCHDLDWLRYIIGKPCKKVSSFGSLKHFNQTNKPVEAGDALRCLDCDYEPSCIYSAKRFYLEQIKQGDTEWPVNVITPTPTVETVINALRTGPYGRCVYECDNDVVDHQVVNMEFEGGATATFTMTAFTEMSDRRTNLFGTLGEIYADGNKIVHYDFFTDKKQVIAVTHEETGVAEGHGGGDYGVMDAFVTAVISNDQSKLLSGPKESLETHLIVFAAEESRHDSSIVDITI